MIHRGSGQWETAFAPIVETRRDLGENTKDRMRKRNKARPTHTCMRTRLFAGGARVKVLPWAACLQQRTGSRGILNTVGAGCSKRG